MASRPDPPHRRRPPSCPDTLTGSSIGYSTHSGSRLSGPRSQARQRTGSRAQSQGLTSSFEGDEDVDSQDFSDSSSDAEGVFAFCPPSTAEQQNTPPESHQNHERLLSSPQYHSSPQFEDVHTLVESPVPLAVVLTGPSRCATQNPVSPSVEYNHLVNIAAVVPHSEPERYSASRPSSRSGFPRTNSDKRIAFSTPVNVREKDIAESVVTEASESIVGFEFDDFTSRDGSKEYVSTSSATHYSLTRNVQV